MIRMQRNSGGDDVEVEVVVETDEDVFLGLHVQDYESGDEILDLVMSKPSEIEAFFVQVERARQDWDLLRALAD